MPNGQTAAPPDQDLDQDVTERQDVARQLLARGLDAIDFEMHPDLDALPAAATLVRDLAIPFPDGLAPEPTEPDQSTDTTKKLPRADVLVVTWTVDEQDALADVLTPGFGRKTWVRYNRNFDQQYAPKIRRGAPSAKAQRLGSWALTKIGAKQVLCFKSELHLNQDGIFDFVRPGEASLPVKDMFAQLIAEVQPEVVLTVGTSGGVFDDHDLGDVAVTRGAKFRLKSEFKNAPYAGEAYRSDWKIPTRHFDAATTLMAGYAENLRSDGFGPPTTHYTGKPFEPPTWTPDIKLDGRDGIPEFHPILTTDYFEYGTSANHLDAEGIAVEMGDAVLGMVCEELGADAPHWASIRNLSDPQINGDLDRDIQMAYAVWYYKKFGYWTSVMSGLTTWAVVAGL